MAEFKGTPGPYTVETYCEHGDEPARGLYVIGPVEADGLPWHLAKVDLGTERDEANAQLFAAAWDLLEALRRIADRAQRIVEGHVITGPVGAADYDLQVALPALNKALGSNQEEGR